MSIKCGRCSCRFVSQKDLLSHQKVCLGLQKEKQKNVWKRSKNPKIETTHRNQVPEIITAIREGHIIVNGFRHWTFGEDMVARCRE